MDEQQESEMERQRIRNDRTALLTSQRDCLRETIRRMHLAEGIDVQVPAPEAVLHARVRPLERAALEVLRNGSADVAELLRAMRYPHSAASLRRALTKVSQRPDAKVQQIGSRFIAKPHAA